MGSLITIQCTGKKGDRTIVKITIDIPVGKYDNPDYYRNTFKGWLDNRTQLRIQDWEAPMNAEPFYGFVEQVEPPE